MVYLKSFRLPSEGSEHTIVFQKKNIHVNLYPLGIFTKKEFE